ncbi:hypothetical protein [Nocardioides albus]|uniref:Multisubunit Na+/H+ antiporter MnhF subunit n=1 Tax=Nocardioides albus TaxID=1841 RepID=A0A7W5A9U5_9ACTN|nr:hypothetical protein [Nocardioides albus]MBB3092014.1 multisubunit Na+/H+ antiporter MnhF subunit [Nocardioides albus]GGU43756.1 hypothetical protein GCM10007979_48700 [Nocardioides albus]
MVGQGEAMWIATVTVLTYAPTIVALILIVRGATARGRVVGLDVLDIVMVLVFSWAGALVYFLIAFLRRRREARAVVGALPAIEESDATLDRVDSAYSRAWAEARTAADDVLIDALHGAGLGPSWTEPGRPQADLLLAMWRAGATPRSASRQLREALGAVNL